MVKRIPAACLLQGGKARTSSDEAGGPGGGGYWCGVYKVAGKVMGQLTNHPAFSGITSTYKFLKTTDLFKKLFNPPSRSASADERGGLIPWGRTPERRVQGSTLGFHTFDYQFFQNRVGQEILRPFRAF
jgi:hypothetical protein